MTLWGSRFHEKMAPSAWALNASLSFDHRLAVQDVRGSLAWAEGLHQCSVLAFDEFQQVSRGLETILNEFEGAKFVFQDSDEDIHTAVERRLGEIIGPLAGKLHTGRSRNDQVATDLRLWVLDQLPSLKAELAGLQRALVERAEADMDVLMPGYTHLQRAQPLLLSHWWLSHFWPLQRDRLRLSELSHHTAILPLGSGALAGTTVAVDRHALARALGFSEASPNSIDAVSDRDFVAEFLFCAALVGVHLSKLAEAMVIFTTAEFGFFELSDAYATGSSLMPQKKNPDIFELARGKAGALSGALSGFLNTLKGLPSTYDKDLQEDKLPLFTARDTLSLLLPVLAQALSTLTIHPQRMQQAIDSSLLSTDLADYLVEKGLTFRQAHAYTGKLVKLASAEGKSLDSLSLQELQLAALEYDNFSIDEEIYRVFDSSRSLARRTAFGGTSPQAVYEQLRLAKESLIK